MADYREGVADTAVADRLVDDDLVGGGRPAAALQSVQAAGERRRRVDLVGNHHLTSVRRLGEHLA